MPRKDKTGITDRHYVDLAQASTAQTTLTAYGKIIRNSQTPPATAGISHPHGLDEPLQASLVFGVAIGGRCESLPSPVQVWLPTPNGPADGCGWDAAEYVVWKNLPRDWVTMHFQARTRTLASALFAEPVKPSTLAAIGVRDRVLGIVRSWAKMSSDPNGSDQLQVLWAASNPAGSFGDGAQILAQRLNDAFGSDFQASDFNPPDKIKTVDDVVDAIP
jgi:hypothetical protein